jgi:hypothetical protein
VAFALHRGAAPPQVAASLFLGTVRGCRRVSSRHCNITFLTRSELRERNKMSRAILCAAALAGFMALAVPAPAKASMPDPGLATATSSKIGPMGIRPMGIRLGIGSVGTSASGCAGTAVGFGAVFAAVAGVITGTSFRATATQKLTFNCRHWPALASLATTTRLDLPAMLPSTRQNATTHRRRL